MRGTLISSRLMGRGGFRAPQNMKPPLRADRGLSGHLNRHDGRIRRSFRLKSSLRTALGLGCPVVPVDWRLEVLSSQGEPHTLILSQVGAPARELPWLGHCIGLPGRPGNPYANRSVPPGGLSMRGALRHVSGVLWVVWASLVVLVSDEGAFEPRPGGFTICDPLKVQHPTRRLEIGTRGTRCGSR
jgi:hypothetical protein